MAVRKSASQHHPSPPAERVSNTLLTLIYRLIPFSRFSGSDLSKPTSVANHEWKYLKSVFEATDQFEAAEDTYQVGKYRERTLFVNLVSLLDCGFYELQQGLTTPAELEQAVSSFLEENHLPSRHKNALLLDLKRITELGGPKDAALAALSDYFASEPNLIMFSGTSKNSIRKEIKSDHDGVQTDLARIQSDFKGFLVAWFVRRVLGVKKGEFSSVIDRAEKIFDEV